MAAAKSLTPTEIQQVLDYISNKPNAERNRCLFLMSVMAGLRVSELAGLTIGDIRNADSSIKAEVYLAAHRELNTLTLAQCSSAHAYKLNCQITLLLANGWMTHSHCSAFTTALAKPFQSIH